MHIAPQRNQTNPPRRCIPSPYRGLRVHSLSSGAATIVIRPSVRPSVTDYAAGACTENERSLEDPRRDCTYDCVAGLTRLLRHQTSSGPVCRFDGRPPGLPCAQRTKLQGGQTSSTPLGIDSAEEMLE